MTNKKRILTRMLLAGTMLAGTGTVVDAQTLTTSEQTVYMAAGREASFAVDLKDGKPDAYNALTLSVQMPEGLNLLGQPRLTSKWENPFCVTQEGITLPDSMLMGSYESIMFYAVGEMDDSRTIKMAAASSNELPGTDVDSLITLRFKAAPDIAVRTHTIKMQDILLEYDSVKHDDPSDVNMRVRIALLGDADVDDKVRVNDATLIVNHILQRESAVSYHAQLADMNGDGAIDIPDVMNLLTLITKGEMPVIEEDEQGAAAARAAESQQNENMTVRFTKNGIAVSVPDAARFTSFQFEVELQYDTKLTDVSIWGGETNHLLRYAQIGENSYRVVGLSLDNSTLPGDEEIELINLNIPECEQAKVTNALFVMQDGQSIYFNDREAETGTVNIQHARTDQQSESVYDLSGRKINNEKKLLLNKGVYIINNKKVVVK